MRMLEARKIAAPALVFAALLATAAAQSLPPSSGATQGSASFAQPRKTHGTFDPATGRFTPDDGQAAAPARAPIAGASETIGNMNITINLKLDPELAKHPVSINCQVEIFYTWASFGSYGKGGGNDLNQIGITPTGDTATAELSVPYWLIASKPGAVFIAHVSVTCSTFGAPQTVSMVDVVPANGGNTPVNLSGSI